MKLHLLLAIGGAATLWLSILPIPLPAQSIQGWATARVRENLNRGVKAVYTGQSVHVSWRLLETDGFGIGFHLDRATAASGPWTRITTSSPIFQTTDYMDANEPANTTVFYRVIPVIAGRSSSPSEVASVSTTQARNYVSINVGSSVGKVGIGDLDGDGTYDFVVRTPQGSIDPWYWNASTSTYKLLAFKSDGTLLWTHDLGPNIEMGIWYSPFVVYDFDGDGKAEVAVKTAPMTPDYSVSNGSSIRVSQGAESLSILNGQTGSIVSSLPWPDRTELGVYNEYSRNQIGVAFLDGRTPCIIAARGTYGVMKASAFQYTGGALSQLWAWKSSNEADPEYFKTGAHSMRCVDVDNDGRDEVILGSSIVDDGGTGLWNNKMGHCDHLYVGDIDPARSGLEMYYGYEDNYNNTQYPYHYGKGISLWDAETGEVIWQLNQPTQHIHDEGLVSDLDPTYPGMELYSGEQSTSTIPNPALLYFHTAAGQRISHRGLFFDEKMTYRAAYWDADLQREAIVRQTLYNFPTNEVVHVAPVKEWPKTAGTGWTYTPPPSGTGSAETTSDGFKVTSSAAGWIYRSDTSIAVTPGQTYRITVDLQNSPIGGHIQLGLTTLNSSGAIVQNNVVAAVPGVTELTVLDASPQPPGFRTELVATYTVPSGITHVRPMFTGNRSGKFLLFNLMVLRDSNPGRGLDVVPGYAAAYADISGDWREEIITSYGRELRIYSTAIPAADRRVTLMQDRIYRLDVAHLAMGYDQVPTTSYCLSQPVEQRLMALAPEADATVRGGGSAAQNFGSSPELSTTTATPDHSYLRFDLLDVPVGKNIAKATLRLRVNAQSGSPMNALSFVANDAWTEASLTWNNKPPLTTPAMASKTVPTAGRWLEFDVTARAQAELDGDGYLSVALTSLIAATSTFSSTEGVNPPHLLIELADAPTPTGATFAGGNGSASSDHFPGIAGGGWLAAWGESNATDIDATVINSVPLSPQGGNYLRVVNGDTTTGAGFDSVFRQFGNVGGVSASAPHTISFKYRLDSPVSQLTGSDMVVICDNNFGATEPGATAGFCVAAMVSNGALRWRVFNGNRAGGGTWLDTTMPVVAGTTYQFTLDLNPIPAARSYSVAISNGVQTVSQSALGYRTANTNPNNLNYICFGSREVTSGQTIVQSIDDVRITP